MDRGIQRGAALAGVTQSTISRCIASLEARFSKRLVQRTTHRVTLTEAGIVYASELREVLQRLENADARVQSTTAEPEGLLRVTMPTTFGRICVIPCIARLADRYPNLRFELYLSDRYVDLLDGSFDAAVRLESPKQSGVDASLVGTFRSLLCVSPTYVAKHGLPSGRGDIAVHSCLALRTYAPRVNWRATWQGCRNDLNISPRITATDATALRSLVLEGAGMAVLPSYLVDADLDSGALLEALPGLGLAKLEMYVAYPKHRGDLRKVTVLIEELSKIPEKVGI